MQFKSRYNTLTKAIAELEDDYGIKVVLDMRIGKDGVAVNNNQCKIDIVPEPT